MIKARLYPEIETYTIESKSHLMEGKIIPVMVAPPEHEIEFNETVEKYRMAKQSQEMALRKLSEVTDEVEKSAYNDVIKSTQEELDEMNAIRKFGGKPRQLRARVKTPFTDKGKFEYQIEILNMPVKWKLQLQKIRKSAEEEA